MSRTTAENIPLSGERRPSRESFAEMDAVFSMFGDMRFDCCQAVSNKTTMAAEPTEPADPAARRWGPKASAPDRRGIILGEDRTRSGSAAGARAETHSRVGSSSAVAPDPLAAAPPPPRSRMCGFCDIVAHAPDPSFQSTPEGASALRETLQGTQEGSGASSAPHDAKEGFQVFSALQQPSKEAERDGCLNPTPSTLTRVD